MSRHIILKVARLEYLLKERLELLLKAMQGRKLEAPHETSDLTNPEHWCYVSESAVRLAADDFQTVLKEIKRTLK